MTKRRLTRSVGMALAGLAWCAVLLAGTAPLVAGTLESVKQRGKLVCGVSEGLEGFSAAGADGTWKGFDVDFCRAVAASIFADGGKVDFVSLTAVERFDALTSGKIDILSRNTTWTLARDVEAGLEYAGVSYYDGQGFMVPVERGLSSALQLAGSKICVLKGTTSIDNARAYFKLNNIAVEIVEHEKRDNALAAYAKGECGVYSADRSALASQRTKLEKPADHMLLPEVISKEPLGPVVRQDDPRWSELVRWVLFLLVNAEEAGWDSGAAGKEPGKTPFSISSGTSKKLGLAESWPGDVIGTVGNYGQIFERNVGKDSALKLERGLNALWTKGGILYAPPMR